MPRLLPSLLRAIVCEEPVSSDLRIDDADVDWLVVNGLGPITHWLTRHTSSLSAGGRSRLHGAELTARVTAGELLSGVERIVGLLREADIECTILKGISYATRYYPHPHLRLMGDVDLLVAPEDLARAQAVLLAAGFELPDYAPVETWDAHHHGPPLKHADSAMTVELHRRLLPPVSAAAVEDVLSLETIGRRRTRRAMGRESVWGLDPEVELILIAAGWCSDLGGMFGHYGHQRALFDAVYLVASRGTALDWEAVRDQVQGTFTGACVGLLFSYLQRHGAFAGPANLPWDLVRSQPFVTAGTGRAIHALLDRHLIDRPRSRGGLPQRRVGALLGALLRRRPSWRNWLAVPRAVLVPPRASSQFEIAQPPR